MKMLDASFPILFPVAVFRLDDASFVFPTPSPDEKLLIQELVRPVYNNHDEKAPAGTVGPVLASLLTQRLQR